MEQDMETIENALIPKEDLNLKYKYKLPEKALVYNRVDDPYEWQEKCREKLRELIACVLSPDEIKVVSHHTTKLDYCTVQSLIMHVSQTLSVPGYLLIPETVKHEAPVICVQGHGSVRGVIGLWENDYHHGFAVELAKAGFVVLVPEIRGFDSLVNLAAHDGRKLIYYNWGEGEWVRAYTAVSDAFMKGYTLIGDTIGDLLAWGKYICGYTRREGYSVAGISYGGDLALILAALDKRVGKTFASGTLGSMEPIFDQCFNAPGHCVPGILKYMDRQEIASCIAPRSLCVHYGELDAPSPENFSAAFNQTAMPAYEAVRDFYSGLGAGSMLKLVVSPGLAHEMDNIALIRYLSE